MSFLDKRIVERTNITKLGFSPARDDLNIFLDLNSDAGKIPGGCQKKAKSIIVRKFH